METLFRIQLSPVPTQTILGLCASMVTAPMDCTSGLLKTGLKVVPPLTDFQTPPLAAPAKTVRRPLSLTAAMAAMRPLIAAEPMLRAGRPDTVPASKRIWDWARRKVAAKGRIKAIFLMGKLKHGSQFIIKTPRARRWADAPAF